MLKTHYLKVPLKNRKFGTSLESVFYNAIPSDELLTVNRITDIIFYSDTGGVFKNQKSVENMLDFMVEQNFIRELNRFYLEKVLEIR